MTFDDSFSIELNSPIDEESWKVIEDAELNNTKHVYFTTPSCKRVDFIKADVLDKIRAEIEFIPTIEWKDDGTTYILASYFKKQVLEIIDKYKADSEEV